MPILNPRLRAACLAGALLVLGAAAATAQGTALVPASDPAYADLDRLNELGLLDSMIVGQRPYSRREVARLVAIARRRAPAHSLDRAAYSALAGAALGRLERRFSADSTSPRFVPLDEVTLVASSTDARRRGFLSYSGGFAEATIDPLAARRLGEAAVWGSTQALELAQRAELASWLAVRARERVEARQPADDALPRRRAELLEASLRARWRNVALVAGREQLTWAQRAGDGLMLASDAPALDQLSLASDAPFALPGFLRRLGPARATLLVADLGASVSHSHSKLLAYKVSVAPTHALELGASFQNHFGGEGARSSSIGNRLIDFIPLLDIFRTHNYYDTTRTLDVESDKVIGIDGRLTLRRLGGLVIAGEWIVDDFDASRLAALFTNDASQSLALILPRVGSPAVSLELSAKHMGIYSYTHTPIENGITTRGRLLGDELGPDAKAFGAVLHWRPVPGARVSVDARTAIHSDVRYFGSSDSTGAWRVYKIASRPDELRDRVLVSALLQPTDRLDAWVRAGGQRIRNARLVPDGRSYVAELGVRVRN